MVLKSTEVHKQADLAAQNKNTSPDELQPNPHTSEANLRSQCGGAIRAARESQGLSVHEIANRLKLSPKQIDAIEADHFAALPEPTIVRGFIRNYAKLLKIDAQPLLNAYMVIVPTAVPYQMAVKPPNGMRMSHQEKSKSGRYALAALALLLGVAVWLFYQHYVAKPSPTQPNANNVDESAKNQNAASFGATNAPTEVLLPEAALPAAERTAEPAAIDAVPSTALTLPAASLPANLPATNQGLPAAPANPIAATASISNPATLDKNLPTVQSTVQSAAQSAVQSATQSTLQSAAQSTLQLPNSQLTASTSLSMPKDSAAVSQSLLTPSEVAKLEFNASQETWVNVVDASGRKVYSKIIFAGSRESVDVKPPVSVTIGNAVGTTMSMNGKPVELAPHSRQNVARIKLD